MAYGDVSAQVSSAVDVGSALEARAVCEAQSAQIPSMCASMPGYLQVVLSLVEVRGVASVRRRPLGG